MKQAADGAVYFDNLPAGTLDIIITAEAGAGLLASGKRGVRLSGITALPGVRRELKEFAVPPVGSLSGTSRLANGNDHAGILVYIPGTGYSALTDKEGNYSITEVPAGIHNLYFEKDGYHRGQIENIKVTSEKPTSASQIVLQISTGAEGFITLANNASVSQEWEVSVSVGATPNAVLMKISESPTFDNLAWKPVVTSTSHTFSLEGERILYVKFADANGLESSPFNDQIFIDRFVPAEASITPGAGAPIPSLSRTINFTLSKPKHATEMVVCTDPGFSSCPWQPFNTQFSYTFSGEGLRELFVRFRDADQFESHDLRTTVEIDLFPAKDVSLKINNGASGTNNRLVNLTISNPLNAHEMMVCEDSGFFGCSWEPATAAKPYTFSSDGYKSLFLKFRDADLFESESTTALILVDTEAPSGSPSVSYTIRQSTMTLNSFGVFDYNPMEMKVAEPGLFAGAAWQPFSGSLNLPYARNLKVQYRDSYGHTTPEIDLKVSYVHTISEARSSIAVAKIGSLFVFAGGYKGSSNYSNVVDIFDSATAFWTTATLSEARSGSGVAVNGTKAYFAGGSTSSGCSSVVDIYDSATNSWSTSALSSARCSVAGASAGDKILFAGGSSGSSVYSTVDIFNTTTLSWNTASLSVARRGVGVAVIGSNIYFIAGNSNTGSLMSSVLDIYDSDSDSWSTGNSTSEGKAWIPAAVTGGKIYIAGGAMQSVPIETDRIESYNPATDQWSTESAVLSTTRQNVQAAVADGLVFFIGGTDFPSPSGGSSNPSSIVDILNPSTGLVSSSSPLSVPRKGHAVATDGTIIIVAGGSSSVTAPTNKVDIYEAGIWSTTY